MADDPKGRGSWITDVFEHPVGQPEWYFAPDAKFPQITTTEALELTAECFENAPSLLSRFTDAELNQGLWFLISNGASDYMIGLSDNRISLELRSRVIRSFVVLFENFMVDRCSQHLSHLDEAGANPLNAVCYMWWDLLPFLGAPADPDRRELDNLVLSSMGQILSLPHDACRESALHGLGHWATAYPAQVVPLIDEFLVNNPNVRPELRRYAESARAGCIQ